ncbi:MAG TPA: L,D-transpeptidase [Methylocystis sp.]|nr:L,D-transpeptidase [Methylocystis sp.]
MSRVRIILLAFAGVVAASAPSKADERSFLALFFGAPAARQPVDVGGAQAYAAPEQDQRLGRAYPSTTRELVADPTRARPGTITIATDERALYLSLPNGQAWRYRVGVGREGFEWRGVRRIGRMQEWPSWTPPAEMLKRRPDLPRHMAGGEDNPLGARAIYLYAGERDSGFRIHGSNEPWTIGEAVSSGCIRMLNADVEDLYRRVRVGTTVVVL